MKKLLTGLAFALAAFSVTAQAAEIKHGQLTIDSPWARASATSKAKAGAAFLMLKNSAHHADRLLGGSSAVAKKVEIHNHLMNDAGVMKMVHVKEGVEVPGMGGVALKPGSYHVMLMGLKAPLKEGETFELELNFEKAGNITVPVTVMGVAAKGMKMDHGGHGSMKKSDDHSGHSN